MKSASAMSLMIRNKKKQMSQTDAGSEDDIQGMTEPERRARADQQDPRQDGGRDDAIEGLSAAEEADSKDLEDKVNINSYAYGGRVLDKRPGMSQGPEDKDLQDLEIERQNQTADQNDSNDPKMHDQGQGLSNEAEDNQEQDEQKMHMNENANHMDNEKELLRRARLKKSMSR